MLRTAGFLRRKEAFALPIPRLAPLHLIQSYSRRVFDPAFYEGDLSRVSARWVGQAGGWEIGERAEEEGKGGGARYIPQD